MLVLILLACGQFEDTANCGSGSVQWNNWGQGFFLTWCSSCHSASSANRYGAPETAVFDTPEQVLEWKERIDIRVIQEQSMPVGGGIAREELDTLIVFLDTLEECGYQQ